MSTRSHTRAANFVFMSSKRVMAGPIRPAGSLQMGLAGNVVANVFSFVLQVVDPALRFRALVRRVIAGRDRPPASRGVVVARGRWTVRVAHHGAGRDVRIAHVPLQLAKPRAAAGDRGRRGRLHDRGARIRLLGGAEVQDAGEQRDDDHGSTHQKLDPVPLEEGFVAIRRARAFTPPGPGTAAARAGGIAAGARRPARRVAH